MAGILPVNIFRIIKRISALALILFNFTVDAQINCDNDSSLLIPIVDLQTDYYFGFQGGLYPDGLNSMPIAHADSGIAIASALMPINFDGEVDTTYGKVVMLGLGNASAGKSFNKFIGGYYDAGYSDSCFRIVNACIEAHSLNDMIAINADDVYWKDVNDFLQIDNLKKKQVRIVWLQAVAFEDTLITPATYVDSLKNTYIAIIRELKSQFINLQQIYISGLHYGGYTDSIALNFNAFAEPAPYFNDFAIKAVIEAQINGDTLLNYSGEDADAAWVAWGPNFWADGRNLRAYDNLRWLCPGDIDTDNNGFILSGTGQQKVADRLLTFFITETTTAPWIFGLPYECFTEIDDGGEVEEDTLFIPEDEVVWITQNPVRGVVKFIINLETDEKADVFVFNALGQAIVDGAFYKIEPGKVFSINITESARGIYILSVFVEGRVYNKLFYFDN